MIITNLALASDSASKRELALYYGLFEAGCEVEMGQKGRVLFLISALAFSCSFKVFAENAAPPTPAKIELNRFEDSIKAYEQGDKKNLPAPGGTEFIGSSTITLWTTIAEDLKELKAFGRGFGGSTIPEATYYVDRIVTKYKPSKVVLYSGTNDIADGASGKQVFANFVKFANKVRSELPKTNIYFISMSMAPSRVQFETQFKEGNKLVENYCKKTPGLHYINLLPAMQNKDGKPIEDLFGGDRLHMKRAGYEIWIRELKKAIPAK
jgi:lysophospholipase L1-like esterase